MGNFWDEEDTVSEYDLLEEAQEAEELAEQYAQEPVVVEADQEEIDQILEESAFNLDEDEANIIYNTRIRLEQARLYEMLINHNLFEGVQADPSAIAIVQNELKHYVVKRLEILMGLRQPVLKENRVSEFNPVELDFLKQLAFKGTKGMSASASNDSEEEYQPAPKPKPGGLKPLSSKVKSSSLKTMGQKAQGVKPKSNTEEITKRAAKQPAPQKPAPKQKAPIKSTQKHVKKKTNPQPVSRSVKIKTDRPRDLTPQELEQLAKEDMKLMGKRKPFHQMTAKEKAQEIARVNKTHAPRPRPSEALPMPDANQLQMKYMTEQQSRSSGTGKEGQFQAIMQAVANNIAANKNQDEE